MTKWNDEPFPSTGKPWTVYAVLYERYYPELERIDLALELAVYDYCPITDKAAWMSMSDRKMLSVDWWCELPERPND